VLDGLIIVLIKTFSKHLISQYDSVTTFVPTFTRVMGASGEVDNDNLHMSNLIRNLETRLEFIKSPCYERQIFHCSFPKIHHIESLLRL
jgi:hypothetical protein